MKDPVLLQGMEEREKERERESTNESGLLILYVRRVDCII